MALGALSVLQGEGSLWRALAGCGIYGGWLFIASLTGLGPGDVKLAAGVGLWLGWLSWSALLAGVAFGQILITICYLLGGAVARLTELGPHWGRRSPPGSCWRCPCD